MNYHRFPVIITLWLTFMGVTQNYNPTLALTQIRVFPSTILLAQTTDNKPTLTRLRFGDKGEGVKLLQNNLKTLGYFQGEINGIFDDKTKKAVSELQTKQGLPVNGIASVKLQELLPSLLFDQSMNKGYKASQNKDYQLAKKEFEQALKFKPNNAYANKAITNTNNYLKIIEETKLKEAKKQEQFWLIGLIIGTSILVIGGGIFLIKKSPRKLPLETSKNPNSETETLSENGILTTQNTEIVTQENSSSNNHGLSLQEETQRLNKVDGIEELIKDLRLSNGANRRKAIWELAQRSDSRAMQPLVQLMLEADSQERGLILEAISQISTRTLKPLNRALAVSLQDENSQVRLNAIRDLTRIYELIAEVNQRLIHATDDEDPEVRETAKWALKNLNKIQLPPDN